MKYFAAFLFVFVLSYASGQDFDYSKSVISKLCSQEYQGRGYSFDGAARAAHYISKQFDSFNLSYHLQPFNFDVNVFDCDVDVVFDNDTLVPAVDFLVDAHSRSVDAQYRVFVFNPHKKKSVKALKQILNSRDSFTTVVFDTVGLDRNVAVYYYSSILNFNRNVAHLEIVPVNAISFQGIFQTQNNYTSLTVLRKKIKPGFVKFKIDARIQHSTPAVNIIAKIDGQTDSSIVFTAHYDHIGTLGREVFFPGAHDNASGTAAVLTLAKYFSTQKPRYTLIFMLFSGEETGLCGSLFYAENPVYPLEKIKFLFNLDMLGSGEKGVQIVNSTIFKREFDLLDTINDKNNYLVRIVKRGEAANSDHYSFYKKGVPCFYIYTLGEYKEYHNIKDKAETLPLYAFQNILKLLIDFTRFY